MEEKKSRVPPSKWTALLQTLQRAYKPSYVTDQFDWIYYLSVIIKFKYTMRFLYSAIFILGVFSKPPKIGIQEKNITAFILWQKNFTQICLVLFSVTSLQLVLFYFLLCFTYFCYIQK